MKQIVILLIAFMVATPAFTQELSKKEQKALNKQFKKEQQAEEAALKAELVHIMVIQRRFVLEADHLRDKRGQMTQVSSMVNFIATDSINGVIQVGSNSYVGMNGVGGITVEGPITNYVFTFNEKNSTYNVSYNVRSSTGNYDVKMFVFPDGRGDATISSSWPGKLSYIGYLVPPASSRVYKGTSY